MTQNKVTFSSFTHVTFSHIFQCLSPSLSDVSSDVLQEAEAKLSDFSQIKHETPENIVDSMDTHKSTKCLTEV